MLRFLFAFFLLPFSVFAQDRLDKSKSDLRNQLQEASKLMKGSFKETDSSMVITETDTQLGTIKMTYLFDKNGKCSSETFSAACDSCIKELLKRMLSRTSFEWRKINENQYVSRYSDRILLELPVDPDDHSFTLFRAQWTKEIYDLLLKQ